MLRRKTKKDYSLSGIMGRGVLLLLFVGVATQMLGQLRHDNLLRELQTRVNKAPGYDEEKLQSIQLLKTQLASLPREDLTGKLKLAEQLFHAYEVFSYDSAFVYALKARELAGGLNDNSLVAAAKTNFGYILVSAGMYKEAFDTLQTIKLEGVSQETQAFYYGLMARYYSDLADYGRHPYYAESYLDSASRFLNLSLSLSSQGTFHYEFSKAFILLRNGDQEAAYRGMRSILNHMRLPKHDFAILSYNLAELYQEQGQKDSAIYYWGLAAIADIESSTKETAAMAKLAGILLEEGELRYASMCIKKANEDAIFYGAKQRKIQVADILPVIEERVITTLEQQKRRLLVFGFMVTALLLVVAVLAVVIYRQVGRLKAEKIKVMEAHLNEIAINARLSEANRQKESANEELNALNKRLQEANRFKEEYLGYLFKLDIDSVERFERLKKNLLQKMESGNLSDALYLLRNLDLEKEKSTLLQNFDELFMRLFPLFIQEFNTLFDEKSRIVPKGDQLLNNKLRIFALMRLGITENEKIAKILGFSVNTIYMYKTQVRNSSLVANEDFDQKLLEITTLGN